MDRKYLEEMGEPPASIAWLMSQADPALSDETPGEGLGMAVSQEGDGS